MTMRQLCLVKSVLNYFSFFFQAEDGIRDYKGTGVQTCALPIWRRLMHLCWVRSCGFVGGGRFAKYDGAPTTAIRMSGRSEERRVGKECRCREGGYHGMERDS